VVRASEGVSQSLNPAKENRIRKTTIGVENSRYYYMQYANKSKKEGRGPKPLGGGFYLKKTSPPERGPRFIQLLLVISPCVDNWRFRAFPGRKGPLKSPAAHASHLTTPHDDLCVMEERHSGRSA